MRLNLPQIVVIFVTDSLLLREISDYLQAVGLSSANSNKICILGFQKIRSNPALQKINRNAIFS